jgi:hypothetical protein
VPRLFYEGYAVNIQTGLYRHYKGQQYRVFGVVQHSESEETLVLYQALYGAFGVWVRPLSMFIEQVEIEGQLQPRFALLQAEETCLFDQKTAINLTKNLT